MQAIDLIEKTAIVRGHPEVPGDIFSIYIYGKYKAAVKGSRRTRC
jgi:hypothetical protein